MPKKVTIINQVAGPMCIDIANAYIKRDIDALLITGVLEPTYALLDNQVKVIKNVTYKRNKPINRILTWIVFFIQSLVNLLFGDKSRKLLLVSNPPLTPFLGVIMYKLFRQEYDILIYDIYPDILVEMGYISESSIIYKIFTWFNKKTFTHANRVITLSNGMKEVLSKYILPEKIEVIPCWVDSSKIKPISPKEKNWFARKYNQIDKCTVLYSGNMGAAHDIESIIEAAADLKEDTSIHFMLIGDGVKKEKIKKLIASLKLNNLTLLPFQDAEVVPFSMACGDISIVTTEKNTGSFLVPSKTFYYIAAGAKVLSVGKIGSELEYLVSENNIGVNISHQYVRKNITQVIKDLSVNISSLKKEEIAKVAKLYSKDHAEKF